MKKIFLKFIFTFLIATIFATISCGDDNLNPNGGGGGDENIRSPMSWGSGNLADSFTDKPVDNAMIAALSVSKQEADKTSILNLYKQFTQLRNNYAALGTGEMTKHEVYNEDNADFKNIAAWYRTEGAQKVLVIHNFAATDSNISISQTSKAIIGVNGEIIVDNIEAGGHTLQMGAYSTIILEL